MKLAVLAILYFCVTALGLAAIAAVLPAGKDAVLNHGPHGLSEILYATISQTGNNGSAFAGLTVSGKFWSTRRRPRSCSRPLLLHHPVPGARRLARRQEAVPASSGTFPTDRRRSSSSSLVGVILIVGALTFFPAFALGPIVEQLLMNAGQLFSWMRRRHDRRHRSRSRPQRWAHADAQGRPCASLIWPAIGELVRQAGPARRGAQPGDVRRRDRQRDHDASPSSRRSLPGSGRRRPSSAAVSVLALVHGAVRQLRRGDGRGPRQGAGRHAAQDARPRPLANRRRSTARSSRSPPTELRKGDVVVVVAGEIIPGDGDVIEGIASVDESAITGESAPVIRESGGDRSAVTGGTTRALRPHHRPDHRRTRARRSSTA